MTNIAPISSFSDRLSLVIAKSNVKKKDFAKKCGKSEPQIYAYLNGTQLPGTDFFRKLKEEFPQDEMLFELHFFRAVQYLKKKQLLKKVI